MPQGLFYSMIDMRLDGGLGDVVMGMKNIPVPGGGNVASWMSGTRHHNNIDAWLVVRNVVPNQFLAYKISPSGLSNVPVVSPSSVNTTAQSPMNYGGVLKISPDGTKLITCYICDTITEFCNFNDQTGVVSPMFKFSRKYGNQFYSNTCGEFSRDSKYIYFWAGWVFDTVPNIPQNILYQHNAFLTDSLQFVQSGIIIDSVFSNSYPNMQAGIDGKLYSGLWVKDSMAVINNPNVRGIGCNFQQNMIWLKGNDSGSGLPQLLQKYKAYIHQTGTCEQDSIQFNSQATTGPRLIPFDGISAIRLPARQTYPTWQIRNIAILWQVFTRLNFMSGIMITGQILPGKQLPSTRILFRCLAPTPPSAPANLSPSMPATVPDAPINGIISPPARRISPPRKLIWRPRQECTRPLLPDPTAAKAGTRFR